MLRLCFNTLIWKSIMHKYKFIRYTFFKNVQSLKRFWKIEINLNTWDKKKN